MKTCKSCNMEKELNEFKIHNSNRDRLTNQCKSCINIYQNFRYSQTRKSKRVKKTVEEKRERYRIWQANKKKLDPLFKFDKDTRKLIYRSFKNKNFRKNSKSSQILGCSMKDFKVYIERRFESWMSWENHGKYNGSYSSGWDLDHIVPISSATTIEEIKKLNHYTNFQPLCSKINRFIKKNKNV